MHSYLNYFHVINKIVTEIDMNNKLHILILIRSIHIYLYIYVQREREDVQDATYRSWSPHQPLSASLTMPYPKTAHYSPPTTPNK